MSSTWFISAGGKGIGLAIVKDLLDRPSTTVVATTRNGKPTDGLAALTPAAGSKLIVLPLEVSSPTGAKTAVDTLEEQHGITHLDVVWANAGVIEETMSLVEAPVDTIARQFDINTLGPLKLLQASLPLLRASKDPKFVVTSSAVGSVELASRLAFSPPGYGASKAAVNYLVRRLNNELKDVAVVALHPGLVDTDMGGPLARRTQRDAITTEESSRKVLAIVDKITKETADQLHNYDQTILPW